MSVCATLCKYCHYLLKGVYPRFLAGDGGSPAIGVLLCQLTRLLLMISGNNYTVWNIRKRLLRARALSPAAELSFSALVLSFHTKAEHGWAHRKWLVQAHPELAGAEGFHRAELAFCGAVITRRRRNYYSWVRRFTLVGTMPADVLWQDVDDTRRYLHQHPTDWSCMWYRYQVFAFLLSTENSNGKASAQLEQEINFVKGQMELHPEIQALGKYLGMLATRLSTTKSSATTKS